MWYPKYVFVMHFITAEYLLQWSVSHRICGQNWDNMFVSSKLSPYIVQVLRQLNRSRWGEAAELESYEDSFNIVHIFKNIVWTKEL
jgi:hypothetical protein